MKQLFYILIAAVSVLFSGCQKLATREQYSLDARFKSVFGFPSTSSWVYYLSSDTHVKENVTIKNKLEGKMRFDNLEQEFISYELHSDKDSIQLIRCMATGENTARWSLLYKDSFYRQVAELYYSSSLFSGIMGNGDTVTYLQNLSVGDVMYYNVVELKSARKKIYNRLYFSENAGIVRKDYTNGKVFLLKSFRY